METRIVETAATSNQSARSSSGNSAKRISFFNDSGAARSAPPRKPVQKSRISLHKAEGLFEKLEHNETQSRRAEFV
jgi:hypothetical protein